MLRSDITKTIDLILTNRAFNCQNAISIENGLSDFHCVIVTVVKGGFTTRSPMIISYRDYCKFDFDIHRFRKILETASLDRTSKLRIVMTSLKFNSANDGPCMRKSLRIAIINRTRLHN